MQESRSALIAYYYFDFKDVSKRDIRGLLTSILLQLIDDSDRCLDLLSQLHKKCHNGSEQPSEVALAQCLKSMLDLPGQLPTYIIIDALDECPNTTGTGGFSTSRGSVWKRPQSQFLDPPVGLASTCLGLVRPLFIFLFFVPIHWHDISLYD